MSLFVPGVGMTSVPNVPAAADVPAVTYIHAVAGIPAVTDCPAVAIGILNIWLLGKLTYYSTLDLGYVVRQTGQSNIHYRY